MNEFALQDFQAAGILGNLGYESGGLRVFQEKLKPGRQGRGGLGWAQWTASRRVNFETFCQKNGFDTTSDEGNFGFLRQELQEPKGEKRKSIVEVKKATTQRDAVRLFEADFERAGPTVKRYEQRDRWAKLALEAFGGGGNERLPAAVAKLLDPDLGYSDLVSAKSADSTFWIITQIAEHGGQVLIQEKNGTATVLAQDTTVFPLPAGLPANVAAAFATHFTAAGDPHPVIPSAKAASVADAAARILAKAQECDGTLVTRDVPNTNSGRLACAWAVNEVIRRALGKPAGGGLSTAALAVILKDKHRRLGDAELMAGAIVISPTRGSDIGHVGIVGNLKNQVGDTTIYSNSSERRVFSHVFTLDKWERHYKAGKALDVLFYAVNPP